jgi:hypothetical protein
VPGAGDLAKAQQPDNGKIPYSRRDAQSDLGCGSTQATRYLRDAHDRGFISPTRRGSFDWKRWLARSQSDHVEDHDGALQRAGPDQRLGSLGSAR